MIERRFMAASCLIYLQEPDSRRKIPAVQINGLILHPQRAFTTTVLGGSAGFSSWKPPFRKSFPQMPVLESDAPRNAGPAPGVGGTRAAASVP
jgi:hypothetical protein